MKKGIFWSTAVIYIFSGMAFIIITLMDVKDKQEKETKYEAIRLAKEKERLEYWKAANEKIDLLIQSRNNEENF